MRAALLFLLKDTERYIITIKRPRFNWETGRDQRSELLAVRAKYDELVDKVHKGLWSGGELDRYRSEPPVAFRLPRIDLDAVAHEHGTLARVIERPEVGAYGLASLD